MPIEFIRRCPLPSQRGLPRGTAAAEYLLDDEGTRNIPLIFITAAIKRDEAEERLRQIHGHPILAKPVAPVEVMTEIEKILTLT